MGKTTLPQPSANFTSKRTYGLSCSNAFPKVEQVLEESRIAIASADKAADQGRIQTGYIQGSSRLMGLGLVASQSTRYRYSIGMRSPEPGKTAIAIVCKIESTMTGRAGSSQWTDVSGQNTALVSNLENWLYEQIEKKL